MRHGFAALCIEQRGFGERAERRPEFKSPSSCESAAMHALVMGRTLVGERVFDVDRGLDYLASRGDVDMGAVGVMGISGGGVVAIYSAALLDRLSFAMACCSFATAAGSIMKNRQCVDNYIPDLAKWADMDDIIGLFAPRPVVVAAGNSDPIFPLDSVREAFGRLQQIYRDTGAADNCALVIAEADHRFTYGKEAWACLDLLVKRSR